MSSAGVPACIFDDGRRDACATSDNSNGLANKVDQTKFDAEMHQLEANLNQSIATHAARTSEKIAESIGRTNEKIAESIALHAAQTDAKIAESKADMIRWMFIFWVGQVAAMVSIIKLLK